MACWMCDDARFRSVCTHHPSVVTAIRGEPLRDPSPPLERRSPEWN